MAQIGKISNTAKRKKATGNAHHSNLPDYLLPVMVGLFAVLLYWNTLDHFFALDDDIVTRGNTFVQKGFGGIADIFTKGFLYGFNRANDQSYRPITLLSFAVEVGIWGSNPKIHHLFNALYYAIACSVLFLLLKRTFSKFSIIVPLAIALLFVAHPVHTEAVANIKSRDEIFMLLFLMGNLLFIMRYHEKNHIQWLILSFIFFFLALLSKEQSITFVIVIPLFLFFFSNLQLKRIGLITTLFIVLSGIYMILRANILDTVTFHEKMSILNNSLSAATNIPDRIATAILILGKYLSLLFVPHPLSWDYSFNQIPIVSFTNPTVLLTIAILMALLVFAVVMMRKKDVYSFSIFYFFITISMVSNIAIQIGSTLGERFLLTPSLAFCIPLVFMIGKITKTNLHAITTKGNSAFYLLILIILALCSVKTINRNLDWKNNLTLFESGIMSSPNSTRAHAALAFEYYQSSKTTVDGYSKNNLIEKARKEFETSLIIYPDNNYALYNLAVLEHENGNLAHAIVHYKKSFAIDPKDVNSLNNIICILIQQEQYDTALIYMMKNLELTPEDATLTGNIGAVFQRMKNYPKATLYLEKSIHLKPDNFIAYDNIIDVFNDLGDTAKASYFRKLKGGYGSK